MPPRTKLAAAVAILAAGTGLALLFPAPGRKPTVAAAGRESLVLRRDANLSDPAGLSAEADLAEQPGQPVVPPTLPRRFPGRATTPPVARLSPPPPRAEPPRRRTHRVNDGDSLRSLALRYLDDAARADEIYALNRDLISDPEVLPIGRILAIPARPRSHSGPLRGEAAPPATVPAGAPRLVPVPRFWLRKRTEAKG